MQVDKESRHPAGTTFVLIGHPSAGLNPAQPALRSTAISSRSIPTRQLATSTCTRSRPRPLSRTASVKDFSCPSVRVREQPDDHVCCQMDQRRNLSAGEIADAQRFAIDALPNIPPRCSTSGPLTRKTLTMSTPWSPQRGHAIARQQRGSL